MLHNLKEASTFDRFVFLNCHKEVPVLYLIEFIKYHQTCSGVFVIFLIFLWKLAYLVSKDVIEKQLNISIT